MTRYYVDPIFPPCPGEQKSEDTSIKPKCPRLLLSGKRDSNSRP